MNPVKSVIGQRMASIGWARIAQMPRIGARLAGCVREPGVQIKLTDFKILVRSHFALHTALDQQRNASRVYASGWYDAFLPF